MENNSNVYLHGDLDLTIMEARRQPEEDLVPRRHHHRRRHHFRHPYVKVYMGTARVARTTKALQNPVWNQHFEFPVAHPVDEIEFQVRDTGIRKGRAKAIVPAARTVATGELIDSWFPVGGLNGIELRLRMKFTPFENSIRPGNHDVRRSYFPLQHGGKVTLYGDAHVIERVPPIKIDGGRNFEENRCWEDICHAISEARHLVYVVGWSVSHEVRLVREPTRPLPDGGELSLGELLKFKSDQQGVRVVLLVWDDKTTHFKKGGIMETHDKETRRFFKHSSVTCVLAPRYRIRSLKEQFSRAVFSHHQKCVIVDVEGGGADKRKIAAFLGGLDLCGGRYDTPDHRLYDTVFKDDYYNPLLTKRKEKGPRQPWHDLHCKVEGPAAYDVLKNFEQLWEKATQFSQFGRLWKRILGHHHQGGDALVDIEHSSTITSPSETSSLPVSEEDDPENWHTQIFRSIDSSSLEGFPRNFVEAREQNLVYEKKLAIDRSIQMAYIQAIRGAQHFIYIENQYFIGSSFAWEDGPTAGGDNLIPVELALKIASKIRANERFSVYVVIPMWPEGKPGSRAQQEILYMQRQTMQMMYEIVARELESAELENAHPTDYLNFYCLGKREERRPGEEPSSSKKGDSSSEKHARFMIYVHSKGMIVDDQYVIIGSANMNERSLAGSRDTEIAIGAYQPHYTWTSKKEHPHGQIYGYRMSLWAEHVGCIDDCFKDPGELDCVKYVNRIAMDNWDRYVAEKFSPLQGHILKYPLDINADGKVKPLPDNTEFPDVGGFIIGDSRFLLPTMVFAQMPQFD